MSGRHARSRLAAALAAGLILAFAGPAGAADAGNAQARARAIVHDMADSVIAVLRQGASRAAREATFRTMYTSHFDRVGIAAWAAGRAYRAAAPAARADYLAAFDDYIVKAYSYELTRYKGQKLRIDKTDRDGGDVIVDSELINPDLHADRNIEMKWRLHQVGDSLLVSDVVIDKISMALTEKRAFNDWLPTPAPAACI
jgi:ABC-type transporter MlaC component